jgi:DUF4097 and DUF4098 domain-containing protein YvlB
MSWKWAVAAFLLPAASLLPAAAATSTTHSQYALTSGGRVQIDNRNGAVSITGWDQNSVDIEAEKHGRTAAELDQIRLDVQSSPDSLVIRTVTPEDSHGGLGVSLRVKAPRHVVLDHITSSNGALAVTGIEGQAELTTSNGPIRIEDFKGRLHATTSNGPVVVRGLQADATSRLELATSNGPIEVALTSSPVPEIHATTSNGPITLWLSGDVSAHLKASTSNGPISSDFEMTLPAGWHRNSSIDANLGSGGSLLELRTSNAPIHIRRGTPKETVSSRFFAHGPK